MTVAVTVDFGVTKGVLKKPCERPENFQNEKDVAYPTSLYTVHGPWTEFFF